MTGSVVGQIKDLNVVRVENKYLAHLTAEVILFFLGNSSTGHVVHLLQLMIPVHVVRFSLIYLRHVQLRVIPSNTRLDTATKVHSLQGISAAPSGVRARRHTISAFESIILLRSPLTNFG